VGRGVESSSPGDWEGPVINARFEKGLCVEKVTGREEKGRQVKKRMGEQKGP